jgi:hypothetical protein
MTFSMAFVKLAKNENRHIQIIELFKKALESTSFDDEKISLNEIKDIIEHSSLNDFLSIDDIFFRYEQLKSENDQPKTLDEVSQYVREHLLTTRDYYFYFPIYTLTNFPEGYEIADCSVRTFERLPSQVQEKFQSVCEHDYEINPGYFPTFDQFLNHRKKALILQTPTIQANSSFKATEKAKEIIENSLNPLRILNNMDFRVREHYFGLADHSICEVGEHRLMLLREYTTMRYNSENDLWIDKFNSAKQHNDEIYQKIAKAIRMYGTAVSIGQLDVKFALLVFALEALLGGDKDYLGWKLAERTAFLISSPTKRKETYRKVYDGKRSGFVHQAKKTIAMADYHKIEGIVINVIKKLFELRDNGYNSFSEIIEYIDDLKFSKSY